MCHQEFCSKMLFKLVELFSGHHRASDKQSYPNLRSLITFIPAGNKWQCLKFGHVQKRRFLDTIWTKTIKTLPPLAVNFLFTSLLPIFSFFSEQVNFTWLFYGGKSFSKHPKDPEIILKEIQITVERNFRWNFLFWLSGSSGVNVFYYSIM